MIWLLNVRDLWISVHHSDIVCVECDGSRKIAFFIAMKRKKKLNDASRRGQWTVILHWQAISDFHNTNLNSSKFSKLISFWYSHLWCKFAPPCHKPIKRMLMCRGSLWVVLHSVELSCSIRYLEPVSGRYHRRWTFGLERSDQCRTGWDL